MNNEEIRRSRHAVYSMKYHFVWIPKRRKKVLVGNIAIRLDELVHQIATEKGWEVIELSIQPDHVHLFIETDPFVAAHKIIREIKGPTSSYLRSEFPQLKRIPSLWTRSYFVRTAGHVSQKTIERYIQEQSTK